ncbi:U-scoloptoxin(19)-Tl1a [Folsomia candida]|uniref:WAP domain-containing protein n=1 Tax=Folsomia candida TaxID=158441 RepID=A0A226EUV8_FOLCA|nr:U-scoloptoxin(19)-Tl1a [Folsomia candida]OXA61372.1 hypothetical protein Fcan01_01802 [Folsomia candida]
MFVFLVIATLNIICNGQPMKGDPMEVGNLKYTFGTNEEIPAAFLDNSETRGDGQRFQPACQDGSGGICVTLGDCPPALRPASNNTNACPPGLECCFGPAENDRACRSRGGECTSTERCGKAPVFREANDCAAGEVCCIFL